MFCFLLLVRRRNATQYLLASACQRSDVLNVPTDTEQVSAGSRRSSLDAIRRAAYGSEGGRLAVGRKVLQNDQHYKITHTPYNTPTYIEDSKFEIIISEYL